MRKLKDELELYLGAYYSEAPVDATYPYNVFDIEVTSKNDNKYNAILEVNVWDKNKYYSRAEAEADKIEHLLDGAISLSDDVLFYCFDGSRQHVLDEDKQIKRIRMQFELYFYERS
ncbi:MAG: hypothetical protein KBT03_03775 [Bacteroidales bacterium]|nr:hypothetical protein [Candidatus Scybalousia scybalohippi]